MSGSAEQSQYTCRRDQSCYNRSICRRQAFLGADFRIFGKRGIKTGLASGSADESEGSANFRTQSLISATWASSIGLESHDTDFEENPTLLSIRDCLWGSATLHQPFLPGVARYRR
jgi:hypothetical protein